MSPDFLRTGTLIALLIALLGTLYRVGAWLARDVGGDHHHPRAIRRLGATMGEALRALVGPRVLHVVAAFVFDVLLQGRLLTRDPVRWLAHFALFVGFSGLLVVHGLAPWLVVPFVDDFAATVNPWLWLRDVLGLLALLGLLVGIARRRRQRGRLPQPTPRDPLFVWLVASIVCSGFLLSGAKIIDSGAFDRMLEEYSTASDDEVVPLKAYWAADFGVVFGDLPKPLPGDALEAGRELHEMDCAECHSRPQAAFVSYPVSRALAPLAEPLSSTAASTGLLYLHVCLCLLALAYVPFGRAFHVLASPASLLATAGGPWQSPEAQATRRALALDACVRCGLCDERCSVRPLATALDDAWCLPSVKLDGIRRSVTGALAGRDSQGALGRGAHACTDCQRCTRVCPVGLDLDDLWAAGRQRLAARGEDPAARWVREHDAAEWADRLAKQPAPVAPTDGEECGPSADLPATTSLTGEQSTFSPCVQCQTCTNVCPVVEHSAGDGGVDASPQKIMNLLRLGKTDLALGSRMVWDCATCYQCQEHCPAGIRVTDVLYELRNRAGRELGALRPSADRPSNPMGAA
jgi:heterodisulfide reductase subunit C/nitrate reductase gamma subunit